MSGCSIDCPIWELTMCDHTMTALIIAFALWVFLTLALMRRVNELKRRFKPMYYSDDPARDFARHDADQARALEKLPVCEYCWQPIQDEEFYQLNGVCICESCMADFKKRTEDYIE